MEKRWLEDFLAVAAIGNFTQAAQVRGGTQSALSRRIQALEEWLGAELFDRNTKPVSLSDAGKQFLPVAEEVCRQLQSIQEQLSSQSENAKPKVHFAIPHGLSLWFFPQWLSSTVPGGRDLDVRLESMNFLDCMRHLRESRCHFAMSHAHPAIAVPLAEQLFESAVVGRDALIPVTMADAHGAPVDRLPGEPDDPIPLLAYSEESAIGQAVNNLLNEPPTPVFVTQVFTSHLAGVLRSLTREGRGLAWVPESMVQDDIKLGRLAYAGDDRWRIPTEIRLYRAVDPLPKPAEELWTFLNDA
ncbi:LysR family transcriptional regulator [Ruegeria sp.]|uniref:LysR family transcriptional regulator n=1 Tax=Ruegeria sp. TaxID=1879320 RepID=UPI0023085DB7|nr:LysR family transcriptional regulator [Ruegeria sp.]MDA7963635.1 LysR substrate-binding domain-containing protein [Ruegeria sp.]